MITKSTVLPPLWRAGDSDAAFRRACSHLQLNPKRFAHPHIHSRVGGGSFWLVAYPNFASDEEIASILSSARKQGFSPSRIAKNGGRVDRKTRTSTGTFVPVATIPVSLVQRIEQVTGVARSRYEPMQVE